MGERIIYFCDICGETMPDFNPNSTTDESFVSYTKDGTLIELDACDVCLKKVANLIEKIQEIYIMRGKNENNNISL